MKQSLKDAVKTAMKEKNKIALDTLRSVLAAIQYEEMQKSVDELSSEATLALLKNEVKKRKEAIEFEQKAQRLEQIETLNQEIAILEKFLPSQITGQALRDILVKIKSENSELNMGQAMKILKDLYPSQYDGKEASNIAKEVFA